MNNNINEIGQKTTNNTGVIATPCMYLTTEEAVEYIKSEHGIKTSASKLSKLRSSQSNEGAPRFTKILNRVYYTESDLDAWVSEITNKNQ